MAAGSVNPPACNIAGGPDVMSNRALSGWQLSVIITILALGTLWVAFDGKHYWHGIRFLYAASEFPLNEIMAGVFNPHEAWGHIDEISSAGFYASKYLHIVLLKWLLFFTADAATALQAGVYLSVLLIMITVAVAYLLYERIFASPRTALFCVACLLLAPVIPYLAGKLVSEVTSLFITVVALVLLVKSIGTPGIRGGLLACAAGMVLVAAGLARIDSLFGPAGFCIAAIAVPLGNSTRRDAVRTAVVAFVTCTAGYLVVAGLAGFSFEIFLQVFHGVCHVGAEIQFNVPAGCCYLRWCCVPVRCSRVGRQATQGCRVSGHLAVGERDHRSSDLFPIHG